VSPAAAPARFLIVGAGVAGLSLAHALEQRGATCLTCADPADPGGATAAAAGLVNPLAGRRWALPWRGREAATTAAAQYGAAWRPVTLVRLAHPTDQHRLPARLAAARAAGWDAAPLGTAAVLPDAWPPVDPASSATVEGALVAIANWCAATRASRHQAGQHLDLAVSPADLRPQADGSVATPWGEFTAAIVATGAALAADPRVAFIPWQRSAGARVDLAGPVVPAHTPVLCGGSWLCPTPRPGHWELGATTVPLQSGQIPPSPPAAATVADQLWHEIAAASLPPPWQVTGVRHGIRLALPDHRPVAGRLPGCPAIAVLAGFGGRGVLHAPWAASQLAAHLLADTPLPADLDLARWAK